MQLRTKLTRVHKRLALAAKILTGNWSAGVSQRQAELEAAMSPKPPSGRTDVAGLPKDLEAVLVHSARATMEIERLTLLYASLASRIASLEQSLTTHEAPKQ
jgi:hypothetical protein